MQAVIYENNSQIDAYTPLCIMIHDDLPSQKDKKQNEGEAQHK